MTDKLETKNNYLKLKKKTWQPPNVSWPLMNTH